MKRILLIGIALLISTSTFAQDMSLKQLEDSPRHHEWVQVKYSTRVIECFLVYPEVAEKAPVVLLIHENRGLNNWARAMADDLAAEGYIVIAPDLLSGAGPNGGKTSDFANSDDARTAIYALSAEQVTQDLHAVLAYGKSLPAANDKAVVSGFCWGGSQTFRFATNSDQIDASCVFYGSSLKEPDSYARVAAPVYGFYGGNDNRVNATIPDAEKHMKASGKVYEYEIYEGAGHAFMRRGKEPEGGEANIKAREASMKRLIGIIDNL